MAFVAVVTMQVHIISFIISTLIILTSEEIYRMMMFGENIKKRPMSSVNTSIKWVASDFPSTVTFAKLQTLRKTYRIHDSVGLIVKEPHKHTCCPRSGCVSISNAPLKASLRLPFHLHHFFHLVLPSYVLVLAQLNSNS